MSFLGSHRHSLFSLVLHKNIKELLGHKPTTGLNPCKVTVNATEPHSHESNKEGRQKENISFF
jgi:hypothetical protein